MNSEYSPTSDPLFYISVGLFALLTTALPAFMGLARLMPIMQALALGIFVILAVRRGDTRHAVWVMVVWLAVQFALVTLLAWLLTERMESAVVDGFTARGAILEWHFSRRTFPGSLVDDASVRLLEIVGATVGSLLTAGVVGDWFLVRAINLAGLQAGGLMANTTGPVLLTSPFVWLTAVRIAGLAGLTILCTEPLLTGNWSPGYYWNNRRRLALISLGLLIAGLILETLVR
jgi:hypothetical protein